MRSPGRQPGDFCSYTNYLYIMQQQGPIGVFDSGFGGLTVLREIVKRLPGYDYLYLGDNARAPYGNRSFETVYQYSLQCVKWFLNQGCPLIILACNTASAKALRTIQQNDLPRIAPGKRVLGVIRPTAEIIGKLSKTGSVAVLATNGTVQSQSYPLEIRKFFPDLKVYEEACPMWVPLVENNEHNKEGADFFVRKNIQNILTTGHKIDVLLLGCTHYPLLKETIRKYLPAGIQIVSQGEIVASSLSDYLTRHPEIEELCSKNERRVFCTTDSAADFDEKATIYYGQQLQSEHIDL